MTKRSVGNESLEVESESSLQSMMSSPSLFVQRLESSQVNLHFRYEQVFFVRKKNRSTLLGAATVLIFFFFLTL